MVKPWKLPNILTPEGKLLTKQQWILILSGTLLNVISEYFQVATLFAISGTLWLLILLNKSHVDKGIPHSFTGMPVFVESNVNYWHAFLFENNANVRVL